MSTQYNNRKCEFSLYVWVSNFIWNETIFRRNICVLGHIQEIKLEKPKRCRFSFLPFKFLISYYIIIEPGSYCYRGFFCVFFQFCGVYLPCLLHFHQLFINDTYRQFEIHFLTILLMLSMCTFTYNTTWFSAKNP